MAPDAARDARSSRHGAVDLPVGPELLKEHCARLLDSAAGGTFAERLFYRLNIIHLMVGNGSEAVLV
jgi:hypothetical protein